MTKFILGKKQGMSQIFDKDNNVIPVTIIKAGPCFVTQIKDDKRDGYSAIQIGFEKLKDRKVKKSLRNKPYRYIKEFSMTNDQLPKIGDQITVDIFKEGDKIKVSGISKGKGFQGVVKRHGFSGGPATHGHRHVLRRPGSIGSTFPERVIKGKKMPGRTGVQRVTVTDLKIAITDPKNNLLAVTGAIPGPNDGLVEVRSI